MRSKKFLFTLVLSCTLLLCAACGENMNDATGGKENRPDTTVDRNNGTGSGNDNGSTDVNGINDNNGANSDSGINDTDDYPDDTPADKTKNDIDSTVDDIMNDVDDGLNGMTSNR